MNNSVVCLHYISQLHLRQAQPQQKHQLQLSGFAVVLASLNVAEENLFIFKHTPDHCLYMKAADSTGLACKAIAFTKVGGEWMAAGTHIFNHQGVSSTISVDWDDVIICE